jgi:GH43 family beta-xylosidase
MMKIWGEIVSKSLIIFGMMIMVDIEAQTYSNPISDLADPHITYHNGHYYLTGTTGSNITIRKAATLNSLKFAPAIEAFTAPSGGPCCNFWAPELHRIDDVWYVYYTAGNSPDLSSQRTWVIENTADDPVAGTWVDKGQIFHPSENFWAIDGSFFQLGDKKYFSWSGHIDGTNTVQHIFISEMSDPWTLTGPRVMISSPQYLWERNGEVNEAPTALQNSSKLFLFYSASGCWTDDYAVGMLSMDISNDPLDPSSWTKSPNPVFVSNSSASAYGPGHNAFFSSPDGTEIWNTYHATTVSAGACDYSRTTRAQMIRWNADGTPNLGQPVLAGEEFDAPSGEIDMPVSELLKNYTYKLVSRGNGKVLSVGECSPSLGANAIQSDWSGKDCQRWNIQATDDGYFVLTSVRGGLALDVAGCSTDEMANVHMWAPNGAHCQQWKVEELENGYYRLVARNSNKALTVLSNSGGNILQQTWSESDNQQWSIEEAEEVVTSTEKNPSSGIAVFPNPAKNAFTISEVSSEAVVMEVVLCDLLSRVVYQGVGTSDNSVFVDTKDLASGIYLLHIKTNQKELTTKIIIEK